ncbi:T9SS sorting signal type C domain-containing protein [Flavobacterium sp. RSB2_4_14]|uniref:T9SS sorting signal type C domain-containing protein n=1 Tax=Flavobacterium sp. RSB2_4_14 TaxID=3447665 RepID=UPI003F36BE63
MKAKILLLILLFSSSFIGVAQCTISSNVNASTLVCGTAPLTACNGVLYIGNGTNNITLTMNDALDLSCLGPIQVIVNNATIFFRSGNNRLTLAEGSSIIFINGGTLSDASCNASERIYIGSNLLASCNGGANADLNFADLVNQGGSGSVTSNSPVCQGNSIILSVTPPPSNGPYTYSWSGPGLSQTAFSSATTYTLIATGSNSGIFSVKMKSNTGVISEAFVTVTVNTGATALKPTVSITQPTCTSATGTITITAPTETGMKYSINGVNYYNTTIFNSVPAGTYSVTAKNSSGCISPATTVTLISSTNTWNGSTWSTGTPNSSQRLVFAGNFTSTSDVEGCSCQVNSGNVEFKAGHTLLITNEVTVSGGSLKFDNSASLVQINDASVNTGNITYVRTTRPMTRWAYVYWGSPIEGNVFSQIPSQFDLSYRWLSGTKDGVWYPLSSTSLGEGFITRVKNIAPFSTGTGTVNFSFVGKPNNGIINVNVDSYDVSSMVPGNTVLLANPYPSAIDAKKFLQHPNNTELGGTLFFWTAVTIYSGTGPYNIQDYGSWNLTGGTAPLTDTSLVPNGKIAAGQGFFAQVFSDGTISFDNTMREKGSNTQFFRTSGVTTEETERNRIWLNLSSENNLRQMIIGYVNGATNSFDRLYDGESFTSNDIDIYSIFEKHNLVIQGRALPFVDTDVVPIGYRVSNAGNYTINIANTDGIFAGKQNIYLLDKKTGIYHDLKAGIYNFATDKGIFNNRFEIRYSKAIETNTSTISEDNIKVVSNYNGISVYSTSTKINKIQIFDVLGKLLFNQNSVDSNSLETIQLSGEKQILIVRVTLDNGQTFTKKAIK